MLGRGLGVGFGCGYLVALWLCLIPCVILCFWGFVLTGLLRRYAPRNDNGGVTGVIIGVEQGWERRVRSVRQAEMGRKRESREVIPC